MPVKTFDTRDAIPEAQRETALELKDGKFAVLEEDEALREGGRAALQAERERADAADKLRKAAEKKAADLEREKQARAAGVSEAELQQIRDAEALARKPIEEERDRLATENRKLKLTDRVQALYLAHGGMADRVEDAMLVLDPRSTLGDAGGIVFKDKDGKVTADDPKSFFAKFKTEKPWLFTGTGGNGGGSGGSDGSGGTPDAEVQQRNAARHAQTARGAF